MIDWHRHYGIFRRMNILVVGGGGREHALAWRLSKDSASPQVFCAPGNAGTATVARNIPIDAEDIPKLTAWARANNPDLVVVGPEAPLCMGIADELAEGGFKVFGPSKAAAQMEGSKVFSKDVMEKGGVPTARAGTFTDPASAMKFAKELGAPVVIKAEGLAAGKGVTVCSTMAEAEKAIRESLVDRVFGDAGSRVLVEEFLQGEEASILALVDGEHVVLLPSAQDHKRVFDRDQGPNTGGMGAYSPAPVVTASLLPEIREKVFTRTLDELRRRGIAYRGVLYAGLMIHNGAIKVLEFNCRFGDPETQAILPRIEGDLSSIFLACTEGRLREDMVRCRKESCVCVVMASGGYPGSYTKGKVVTGLDEAGAVPGVTVFHAGTRLENGKTVTSGGRVLGVTALGSDLKSAVKNVYKGVEAIQFEGAHYRKDIAARAFPLMRG